MRNIHSSFRSNVSMPRSARSSLAGTPPHSPQRRGRAARSRRTPGQRAGVTADAILAAAHRVAREKGLEQVTMRRLASELGVAPNALYSHFANKGALLDAMLNVVLAEVRIPDRPHRPWEGELAALFRASRRALLSHPQLVPLFLARPGGRHALRLGEGALRLLLRGGIDGRAAVEALRTLLVYTLGFVAVEVPRLADPGGRQRLEEAAARIASLPQEEFPNTRAVARHLAEHPADRDFEVGLRWVVRGIAGGN